MSIQKAEKKKILDNSVHVHQKKKINYDLQIREIQWTAKQKEFLELAFDKNTQIMLVKGVAGTSKTTTAMYAALNLLKEKRVSDLILVRSIVESAENKLGYLPGSSDDKIYPYMIPFFDKLSMFLSDGEIKKLQTDQRIAAYPVGFLRGMDWNVRTVIADESQNLCRKELLTLMSRIGKFCKVFILGDVMQSDIKNSGFNDVFNLFNNEESKNAGIQCFEFDDEHVMRSDLCKFITRKFKELK